MRADYERICNTSDFHCNLSLKDLLNQLRSHMMTQPNKLFWAQLTQRPAEGGAGRTRPLLLTRASIVADVPTTWWDNDEVGEHNNNSVVYGDDLEQ